MTTIQTYAIEIDPNDMDTWLRLQGIAFDLGIKWFGRPERTFLGLDNSNKGIGPTRFLILNQFGLQGVANPWRIPWIILENIDQWEEVCISFAK